MSVFDLSRGGINTPDGTHAAHVIETHALRAKFKFYFMNKFGIPRGHAELNHENCAFKQKNQKFIFQPFFLINGIN